MSNIVEPGYMARIEWEYEEGVNYSWELTKVVKYSTYEELLNKLNLVETDLQDSQATIRGLVEELDRVKAGWNACNAKLSQVEKERDYLKDILGWDEYDPILDEPY